MQPAFPQSTAEEYRKESGFYPLIIGREYWHGGQSVVLVSGNAYSHQVTVDSRFGDRITAQREQLEWKPDAHAEEVKSKKKNGSMKASKAVVDMAQSFIEENIERLVHGANKAVAGHQVRPVTTIRDIQVFMLAAKTSLVLFIQEKFDEAAG